MNLKITIATLADASTIATIGRLSFRDAFSKIFNDKKELQEYLDYTYRVEKIEKSIRKENNVFFIAYMENVPVGFAKVKKSSLNEQIVSVAQMELQKVYVLTYYHGSGAGTALMDAVIDFAHQLQPDYIWLDVHIANQKAIKFYKKYGFTVSGKHHFIIGTQTFEYHLMCLPVAVMEPCGG